MTSTQQRQGLHLEVLHSSARLAPLRSEWNALAGDYPFRRWSWLAPWADGYAPEGSLFVVTARAGDGSLVGLAPWWVERCRSGRVLRWLGGGEVYSDHPGLLSRPGYEERSARAMALALTRDLGSRWDLIDLSTVPVGERPVEWLRKALRTEGCVELVRPHPEMGWRISLPDRWDAFLAELSRSHRKQLRRLVRAFDGSDSLVHGRVESAADLSSVWPTVVDLHQRRRLSVGDRGAFSSPRFSLFLQTASHLLLDEGCLSLHWLEHEGEVIAADYQVSAGPVVHSYLVGMSPEHRRLRPGALLTALTIRSAIEEGFSGYDLLRGNQAYKAHLGAEPRRYDCILIANRRAGARLALEATRCTDRVTGVLRALKHRLLPKASRTRPMDPFHGAA